MDEITIGPFSMTPEEMTPVVWKRQLRGIIAFYLMGSALLAFLLNLIAPEVNGLVYILLGLLIFGAMMLQRRYIQLPRAVRKLDAITFSSRTVTLTPEYCSWNYEAGLQSRVLWKLFRKAMTDHGIYLLYLPGGNYLQIPRRVLSHDQEQFLVAKLREIKLLP